VGEPVGRSKALPVCVRQKLGVSRGLLPSTAAMLLGPWQRFASTELEGEYQRQRRGHLARADSELGARQRWDPPNRPVA
jgi:hypothetical protein